MSEILETCQNTTFIHKKLIISPGYPNSYPSNQFCSWILKANSGRYIGLNISNFDVDSIYNHCRDDVEIFNIVKGKEIKVDKFCSNNTSPRWILSEDREIKINFRSGYNKNFDGFKIEYKSIEPGIGFIYYKLV